LNINGWAAVSFAIFSMTKTSVPNARGDQFVDLLTRIAASKDRMAFAAVFDHFAPRVKSFMMRKGSNAEQAEDLVQETMIAVWSKAAMFSTDKGSVSTWIFTIARNLRIDKLRRERAQLYTDLEDFDTPDLSTGAEEALGRSQEDNHVAKALEQIPPEQRDLLILSFVEDVPQSEIAIKLGIPLGTVKSRMRLGYQRLRKILETMN
jgi:RNA polymerase sigma-70 factor, ECF subfamily